MEQFSHDPSINILSIQPREILMNDDERDTLTAETAALIDETFIYRDYCESIDTIKPVELHARPDNAPNPSFRALMPRVYDRAFISAVIDHEDSESFLCYAKIALFKQGLPMTMRTELVIQTDEQEDAPIDLKNPVFYLKTQATKAGEEAEIIPLDVEATKEILHGLLQQSDSSHFQDTTGTFLDMIHSLVLQSPDAQVQRETTCRVTQKGTYGDTTVTIRDKNRVKKGALPKHLSHGAKVKIFQPFTPESGAITSLEFHASSDGAAAKLGVKRTREADSNRNRKILDHIIGEYNDPDLQYPNKFSTQLLQALDLIRWPPEDASVEQWLS